MSNLSNSVFGFVFFLIYKQIQLIVIVSFVWLFENFFDCAMCYRLIYICMGCSSSGNQTKNEDSLFEGLLYCMCVHNCITNEFFVDAKLNAI